MHEQGWRARLSASVVYPVVGASFTLALALLLTFSDSGSAKAIVILGAVALAARAGFVLSHREGELTSLGSVDPLTQLHNRRYFEECLKRELISAHRSREPLALLVVDVDALKAINDQLGHHAGDAAIRVVAEALRGTCRGSDVAARWGGDEFVVLAPNTNAFQAQALVQRINAALPLHASLSIASARLHGQAAPAQVTASVGFAIASADYPASLWPATLFAAADQAMYRKKGTRRISGPLTAFAHVPRAPTQRLLRFETGRR
jgi:diguanylate cyclase (GGDEF)-like protein